MSETNKQLTDPAIEPSELLGYEPEVWQVRKDCIEEAIDAICTGSCYAIECLQDHDERLGRTTSKNKRVAEIMEEDIAEMSRVLEWLCSLPSCKREPAGSAEIKCKSCGWLGNCDDVLTGTHPFLKGCHVYGCPKCGEIERFEQVALTDPKQSQEPNEGD
jgi:hypothetical protein